MASLSDLNLPQALHACLAPLIGDKQVGARGESVWIEQGRIRMELEDLGEGWNGDYDEEDPDDTPLMRFSFYAVNRDEAGNAQYDQLDDCSYCTSIDARAPWEVQLACACEVFNEVIGKLSYREEEQIDPALGRDARRTCERMSNVSSDDRPELMAALQASVLDDQTPQASAQVRTPRM